MIKAKVLLVVALNFAFSLALAQPHAAGKMDALLEAWQETGRFMGAVLVARGGEVVFKNGYGLANVATGQGNALNTVFRLGSLSKPLTATAMLGLQDAGRLSIDDPVSTYLPDYPNGDITLRQLLTHTSGIPDYARLPDYPSYMNIPMTLTALVDKFKDLPLVFPPGTQFSYSNSNYVLLSAVIETVSGQKYGVYMREHVFEPTGMTSSRYGDAAEGTMGYRLSDEGYVPASPIDLSVTAGAGGLVSTVGDLYKWIQVLQNERLLSQQTLAAMTSPAVPVGLSSSGSMASYSLGWYVSDYLGRRVVSHDGGVNGFSSSLLWFPAEDAVVIVLSNLDAAPVLDVAEGLAAILFGETYTLPTVYKEIDLEPEVLKTYAGRYALAPDFIVSVALKDGDLYLEPGSGPKARLHPFSKNEFFLKVADVTLQFTSQNGAVSGFVWQQGQRELQGVRLR